MRALAGAALALVFFGGTARAADDEPTPLPEATVAGAANAPVPFSFRQPSGWYNLSSKVDVSGYILPQFEIVSIRTALPRDRTQYGVRGTRAGFAIYGSPWADFSYIAHLVVAPAGVENVALLATSSQPSVGFEIATTGASLDFEEVSLAYRPARWAMVKAGFVRVPYSIGQTTPIPEQMFPFRPPITGEFQSGADASVIGSFKFFDDKLRFDLSTFLGSSLYYATLNFSPSGVSLTLPQTVRGPAFLAGVTFQPLGEMSTREGDESRGPLRLSFGASGIYRRAKAFDPTGYEASNFDDVRIAAHARASYRGLYAQAEYLRRTRNDDVSGRASKSEGAYIEASYFAPITGTSLGFGPVARASQIKTSAEFAPRTFRSLEAGLAFYPHARGKEPERLRILLEYFLARTSPLDETMHEGVVQLQMMF